MNTDNIPLTNWLLDELVIFTGRRDINSESFLRLVSLAENVMYDRFMCRIVGAQYDRMNAEDREKIYRFITNFKTS